MESTLFVLLLALSGFARVRANTAPGVPDNLGTIAFASFHGRQVYGWEIFSVAVPLPLQGAGSSDGLDDVIALTPADEIRHTQGNTVSYNGHFVQLTDSMAQLRNYSQAAPQTQASRRLLEDNKLRLGEETDENYGLLFTSERDGAIAELYYAGAGGLAEPVKLTNDIAYHDRASVVPDQDRVIFAGTFDCTPDGVRQSCTRVYSLDLQTKEKKLLTTEPWTADYSPAVSPSGEWVAVASMPSTLMPGEVEELDYKRPDEDVFLPTDVYIFRSVNGSDRRLVAERAGWPQWSPDGRALYFHRKLGACVECEWAVFHVDVAELLLAPAGTFAAARAASAGAGAAGAPPLRPLPQETRITPPGMHAFTPAVAPNGRFLAVATRRPPTKTRQVELFDLQSATYVQLTSHIAPAIAVYSPFISPDSSRVGYHRCLCNSARERRVTPIVESVRSPVPGLSLLRVANDFPSFSPDGRWLAATRIFPQGGVVALSMLDFSDPKWVFKGSAFGLNWNPTRNTLYTTHGQMFDQVNNSLPLVAINVPDSLASSGSGSGSEKGAERVKVSAKRLTGPHTGNNAFPAVSPDGKRVVFRSGRSGHKNLYIIGAEAGERGEVFRLTEGEWVDTMPAWSPDGEWIAFSTDREYPGVFAIYMIHPNGTGLHRIFKTGVKFGRVNHPHFSPDGRKIVFCADYSSYSAEPISTPQQFQAYGQVFVMNVDGSGLQRLIFNAWESGVPTWTRAYVPPGISPYGEELNCHG